jgi:PAS domain S-box-containing protein
MGPAHSTAALQTPYHMQYIFTPGAAVAAQAVLVMTHQTLHATYDLRLVALSLVIAIAAAYTALDLAGRVTATRRRQQAGWLIGGACALGSGIWAMHFMGMLAFVLPIPTMYHLPSVVVSLLLAVGASAIALFVVSRPVTRWRHIVAGGVVMGGGIAAMHYTGMAALDVAATITYQPLLLGLSIVIAVGAAIVALWLAVQFRDDHQRSTRRSVLKLGSAALMGSAVGGMHYTGMAAAVFAPGSVPYVPVGSGLGASTLAVDIALATTIVLGLALLSVLFDRRLAAQAAELSSLLHDHPDAVWAWTLDGRLRYANPAAAALTGYASEAMLHWKPSSIARGADAERVGQYFASAARGTPQSYEIEIVHQAGRRVHVAMTDVPVLVGSRINGVYSIGKDVTARHQAEARSHQLAAIVESSDDAVVSKALDGTILSWNAGAAALYGYGEADVIGRSFAMLVPADRAGEVEHILGQIQQGGRIEHYETVRQRKDGSLIEVSLTESPIKNADGVTIGISTIGRNITARKQSERRAALQHRVTEILAETTTLREATPRVLQAICELLRWDVGELWEVDDRDTLRVVECWHRADPLLAEFVAGSKQCVFRRGVGLPGRILVADRPVWVADVCVDPNFPRAPLARAASLHGAFGVPIHFAGRTIGVLAFLSHTLGDPPDELVRMMTAIAQQIGQFAERQHAQEALHRLSIFQQGILNAANYSIIAVDVDGTITSFNAAAERWLGHAAADVVGKATPALFHDHDEVVQRAHELSEELGVPIEPGLDSYVARTRSGEVDEHEWTYIRKDGSRFPVQLSVTCLRNASGVINGYLGVASDILERRRAEEERQQFVAQLQRSNRELEDFASVASHDLQEPLRKIQAFGDRLKTRCAADLSPQGRDYVDRMQHAAGRMQVLINDLLTFSRVTTKAQPFVPVDLGTVVAGVVSDLEVRIEQTGAQIDVADLPCIDADPLQMRQLLQNLIGNALKFHRPGVAPLVTIRCEVGGNALTGEGAELRLLVSDNGIGFDPKYLDRIFTVFQRLHGRDEYEGTGVGLAVCRKIAERHGGSITATSAPGAGATFIVSFPVRREEGILTC